MQRSVLGVLLSTAILVGVAPTAAAGRAKPRKAAPSKTAWLGTALAPLRAVDRRQKRVPKRGGVLVLRALPRSPAARIGLRPGDVLMRIDRRYVFSPAEVIRRIAATPVGRTVQVDVIRNGQWLTAKVRLSARPQGLPGASAAAKAAARPAPKSAERPDRTATSQKISPAAAAALQRRVARLEAEVRRLRRLVQEIRRRR